ncbi:hypothetical protein P3T76_008422 [Phytophthora citrophthora]|uniref:Uncharacterized protein n=1 Tax=Phytophthora citrophthora TaxID=4793 RepID=A0AAD9GKJ5_9STRA|nr:hypothetical protein P3T76_008422 [Phytophthora citrophthora]
MDDRMAMTLTARTTTLKGNPAATPATTLMTIAGDTRNYDNGDVDMNTRNDPGRESDVADMIGIRDEHTDDLKNEVVDTNDERRTLKIWSCQALHRHQELPCPRGWIALI